MCRLVILAKDPVEGHRGLSGAKTIIAFAVAGIVLAYLGSSLILAALA